MTNPHWYAVHTQARQEGAVAAKLWRYFPVFLPRKRVTITRNRRTVSELRVLMPRYLLAKCEPDGFHIINTTIGVATLINVGGEPKAIPERAVKVFRSMFDEDGVFPEDPDEHFAHNFKPGDNVQFKGGPLEGLQAKITRLDKDGKIGVATELFGRLVDASAPAEWAELVA